jgi:hypothetical protein
MSEYPDPTPNRPHSCNSETPPDVSLLLRAHSERQWLSREVIPVVRQIETQERLPPEQVPAATAYLEVIWRKALRRARETDTELCHLDTLDLDSQPLVARARRYQASVQALRTAVALRVAALIAAPGQPLHEEFPRSEPADLHDLIR